MLFLLVAFVACLIARVLNVYPVSLLINCFRKEGKKIDQRFQFVAWFSGLRGAVAFLIAVESWSNQDFPQINDPRNPDYTDSDCILSTTLFIGVITVFTMGGPIGYLLTCLNLRENKSEEQHAAYDGVPGLMGRGLSAPMPAVGSIYVDRKYIKPFLTIAEWDEATGNCHVRASHHNAEEAMDVQLVTHEGTQNE